MLQNGEIDGLMPIDSAWRSSIPLFSDIADINVSLSTFDKGVVGAFILGLLLIILFFPKVILGIPLFLRSGKSAKTIFPQLVLLAISCPIFIAVLLRYEIISPYLFFTLSSLQNFYILLVSLVILIVAKIIILSIVASVSSQKELFMRIFQRFITIFIAVTILLLLPFVFTIVLENPNLAAIRLYCYIAMGVTGLFYFILVSRLFISNRVSVFLCFLYLCTLEILPVALVISTMTKV